MNPFEESDIVDTISSSPIELWMIKTGRKSNTFICGLNFTENELKEHLKILKKKIGCNGSVKEGIHNDKKQLIFQLQGEQDRAIEKYFTELGVKNIKINGKQ